MSCFSVWWRLSSRARCFEPCSPRALSRISSCCSFSTEVFFFRLERASFSSFALGMLSDLFSGAPEGLNALFSIILFVMSKAIQARVFMKGFRAIWGLTILAFVLKVPYYALLSVLFGLHLPTAADGLLIWVGEFVSSLFLMPVLFYVVSRALGLQGGWFLQHQGSSPA